MADRNERPFGFMSFIFRRGCFLKQKNKPVRPLSRKISIKLPGTYNVRRPAKHAKPLPPKIHQNQLPKTILPFSKPIHQNEEPRKEPTFVSGDFSLAISEHRKPGTTGSFYRGSSGNVMLFSHLGNLKQKENMSTSIHRKTIITANTVRKPPTKKLDPEKVKSEGNEKYKKGKFEEALALYNQAIILDPNRASYYSNKSAALMGLGRLVEAVFACKEAVRIEPSYQRAHHRLATLYLRLGEAEKALDHYKQSGPKVDSKDIAKAQALKTLLTKCKKAGELNNWSSLLKETQAAISTGADSAPHIYAMQVDALLKLHRHQEAYNKFQQGPGPHLNVDSCSRFFGLASCVYLLTIQAHVHLAAGRFEDALTTCRETIRISSSDEVKALAKRVHIVVLARSNGNKLFKTSKFLKASIVYSEGLGHDPHNATLLCNRAACELKLGHFEKAAEDCSEALHLRPSYSKAKLRRAECYAKLENWEAAMQDYEILIKETPEDEKLNQAMLEAILELRKQRRDPNKAKFSPVLVSV